MSKLVIRAAQRHAIVHLEGVPVAWHTMTGGGITVPVADDPDTADVIESIPGTPRAEPITLTTSFSPAEDLEWMKDLKRGVGMLRATVTRHWTDENWRRIGEPEVYPDCLLIGYENPTTTRSGDDVEFSITLATTGEAL